MSNLTLYDIKNRFVDLMNKAENEELTESEYNELGQELAIELQNKSAGIIGYVQNEEAFIDAIDVQIKRLQEIKKTKQNNITNFKTYVKTQMEGLDIIKIETELGTLSIAKSPISVEIIDENEISDEYKQQIVTTKVDKKAIADNFKATGEIPSGVVIHTDNTNLRIK